MFDLRPAFRGNIEETNGFEGFLRKSQLDTRLMGFMVYNIF